MKEKGAPAYYTQDRFQYIVDQLTPNQSGFIYLARIDAQPAGMAAVVYAEQTAYLLQVATPKRYGQHRIGDYLVALAQYKAAKAGKQFFDFLATPEFEPGVKEYKAKWGGNTENVEMVTITVKEYRSKMIDLLRVLSRKASSVTVNKNSIASQNQ